MISSKDTQKAKKTCAYLRPANKWLLDLIYAEAEKAGFSPLPDQAVRLLWQTVQRMVEGPQPPHLQDQPGVSMEPTDDLHMLACRIYQGAYHDAVDAHVRHMPGFKKGKPGRKAEIELADRIWKFKAEGRTVPQMQAIFKAEGQHFSREKIESYLKTRRKPLK
jgi:hypothetical protein